jgi:BMFP domain-containing protein YqiC
MQGAIAAADAYARDLAASRAAITSATQALAAAPTADRARQSLARLDALEAGMSSLEASSAVDAAQARSQVASLRQQAQALLSAIDALDRTRASLAALQARLKALEAKAPQVANTRQQATQVLNDANKLEADIAATAAPPTPKSLESLAAFSVQDVTGELAATAKGSYPARPLEAIRRIIVHHTGMNPDASPEAVARASIRRGRPAIPYHYLVTGDGAVYLTQGLDVRTNQSRVAAVDADGVAVAFGGDFDMGVPSPEQMAAAADLLADLLTQFGLGVNAIYGRSEVEGGTTSPGMQWSQGVRWGDDLIALVAAHLPEPLRE